MKTGTPEKTAHPVWLQQLLHAYRAGKSHAFVLHGNIFDYTDAQSDLNVRQHVIAAFGGSSSVVLYSPDEGIIFPGPKRTMAAANRKRFDVIAKPATSMTPEQAIMASAGISGGGDGEYPRNATQAMPMIVRFLTEANGNSPDDPDEPGDGSELLATAVIDRCDLIVPPGDKGTMPDPKSAMLSLLHRAGRSSEIYHRGNIIIMLSPTLEEIHPDLRSASSGIRAIEVTLPNYEERRAYAERCIAFRDVALEDITIEQLAAATAGLGRRHIEDVVLEAAASGGKLTRDLVRLRKRELMSSEYAEVIEVMDTEVTLDMVGGHELAKAFIKRRIIDAFRDPSKWDLIPLGLALLGPPGTGKTFLANALANDVGLNCLLLRAEKIKGSLVGESEQRLAKALSAIEAMAPCLVFIDEIDQKFRRAEASAGDGGTAVESNIFGRLLEFFGDTRHRGRILGVAASNRPDLVDAALFRPGRFDVKIPLLPPVDAEERADVLRTLLVRHMAGKGFSGLDSVDALDELLLNIGNLTDDWTQAELENLIVQAHATARLEDVTMAVALPATLRNMVPGTRQIRRMSELALAECDNLSLVPERWRSYRLSVQEETPATSGQDDESERTSQDGRRSRRRIIDI